MQNFIDFLKEEIDTSTKALNSYYDQVAKYSQKAQDAHADRDNTKVRISVVNHLNKAVEKVEYEEASLHIYTMTLKNLEKHIEEGTEDNFVGTLLTSLSREIGENNFGNSKLSQKDKAYANANFYMFKKIIPFVGYAGN
ncbi:hypothetical protein WE348_21365 (plasmid) [Alteromonas macleodii]|jgi:hypothetical protein|uniref:hypothetical protein n=1 Tax=Alteromonas macleodii TaxID=28108 RepID=UPI000C940D0A|nr:hypothetical protein [Planctomycetota bacterium]HCV03052.1 hypothetical protein [Pseudoalteromonas sp.]|tara:strand:+ start:66042 stop:66458 length:417 start_codon:yes stop_codon:yes gene_type:complete